MVQAEFRAEHVWVRAYTRPAATKVQKRVGRACPWLAAVPWKPHKDYSVCKVLSFLIPFYCDQIFLRGDDRNCAAPLTLDLQAELGVWRAERGWGRPARLWLGDLHPHPGTPHTPTAYQVQSCLLSPQNTCSV